jgi:alanine dehydrogenase
MVIGVPKEIKDREYRVAMVPGGVEALVKAGHRIIIESSAGLGTGITDENYIEAGAEILPTARDVWQQAEMIVKVKEPQPSEYQLVLPGQIIFTYFHFAASEELTRAMLASRAVCIGYETVEEPGKTLPLLIPMSEVAGRMAIQEGAKYLERPMEGRGILLGGVPGVAPAQVVILGGGIVGTNAAKVAAGLGAMVTVIDINLDRLRYLDDIMPRNVMTLASNSYNIREALRQADLLIGAVLVAGARAPRLVTREMLSLMKNRAVLVDVAIDQGGCIETSHPTTHSDPIYIVDGVVHYCVANMPGAVAGTSTYALTNSTLPYILELAQKGYRIAAQDSLALKHGLNIVDGKIVFKGVADAFGLPYSPVQSVIES